MSTEKECQEAIERMLGIIDGILEEVEEREKKGTIVEPGCTCSECVFRATEGRVTIREILHPGGSSSN
jgi:hypothetical protein